MSFPLCKYNWQFLTVSGTRKNCGFTPNSKEVWLRCDNIYYSSSTRSVAHYNSKMGNTKRSSGHHRSQVRGKLKTECVLSRSQLQRLKKKGRFELQLQSRGQSRGRHPSQMRRVKKKCAQKLLRSRNLSRSSSYSARKRNRLKKCQISRELVQPTDGTHCCT